MCITAARENANLSQVFEQTFPSMGEAVRVDKVKISHEVECTLGRLIDLSLTPSA